MNNLKHQNLVIKEEIRRDKIELINNFDLSVVKLKERHNMEIIELKEEIKRINDVLFELENEILRIKKEYEIKLDASRRDSEALHESLISGRKLNELQLEENSRLNTTLKVYKKDNDVLNKEVV
jgi:hypothetical protein